MTDYNRDQHEMIMTCDNPKCGDSEIFVGEFTECIADAKEAKWRIVKTNDDYVHTCALCVHKETDPGEIFK